MNRQIQHYLESYPVEETISIVRREPRGLPRAQRTAQERNGTRNGVPHLDGTSRTDAPPLRHEEHEETGVCWRNWCAVLRHTATTTTHLHCVTTNRRTSIASRRIDAPPLRHDKTKRTNTRTNETAFAPPLQRHEHDQHDRNERHEQRRRPLN